MRQLTITAAEWASVQDGTLWIVREGTITPNGPNRGIVGTSHPPVEFVQACAPCETCGDTRDSWRDYWSQDAEPCTDCRIELVGPCPNAEGCPAGMAPLSCGRCYQIVQVGGTVTLGYAYAVGQPLPIYPAQSELVNGVACIGVWRKPYPPTVYYPADEMAEGILIDLAHYGPPESLVGKWALQLTLAVTA